MLCVKRGRMRRCVAQRLHHYSDKSIARKEGFGPQLWMPIHTHLCFILASLMLRTYIQLADENEMLDYYTFWRAAYLLLSVIDRSLLAFSSICHENEPNESIQNRCSLSVHIILLINGNGDES